MENFPKTLISPTMTSLFPSPDTITGLSGPQKCTIYAAWQLIKKDFQMHARNVFSKFFEAFPAYVLHFNDKNKINIHEHSHAVFHSLNLLIEKGFTDINIYEQHLSMLAKIHPKIYGCDVKNVTDIIIGYLLETLAKQRTNTLDGALMTFFHGICEAFERNRPEEEGKMEQKDDAEEIDEGKEEEEV